MKQPHPIIVLLAVIISGIITFVLAALIQIVLFPHLEQGALMQYYALWILAYLIMIIVKVLPRR